MEKLLSIFILTVEINFFQNLLNLVIKLSLSQ